VGLRQQLTEPWGLAAAGVLGAAAGAAGLALSTATVAAPLALGVAGAAYGVKVAAGLLAERNAATEEDRLPVPAKGSPAEVWLRRAEKAVRRLHEQATGPADPATRARVGLVDAEAAGTLLDLRRLAARVAALDDARAGIDPTRLHAQRAALLDAAGQDAAGQDAAGPDTAPATDAGRDAALAYEHGPALRSERERALAAIDGQLAVHARVTAAREAAVARLQSTATGLDELVARMSEVLALAAAAGTADTVGDRVVALSDDLEGLRAGLAETDALSRRVLEPGRSEPAG